MGQHVIATIKENLTLQKIRKNSLANDVKSLGGRLLTFFVVVGCYSLTTEH